jgi:hypothetical protein
MRPQKNLRIAHRRIGRGDRDGNYGFTWGLSAQLPDWHVFDGLRSRIAPSWSVPQSVDPAPAESAEALIATDSAGNTPPQRTVGARRRKLGGNSQ